MMNSSIASHPQQAQQILEVLSALSYRSTELESYLQQIACGVSELLNLDWSVVTLCQNGQERVMASSLDIGEGDHIYSLHGTLTGTVVATGQTLSVEDANTHPEYGKPPQGYTSYLGVPLQTVEGTIVGTLCSFCIQPRHFLPEEILTAELFAQKAAIALDNYLLYQQQRQFNEFLEAEVAKRTEELKLTQAKLIEQERLAAIGEFAAMIVHEIRNPLTSILMGLTSLQNLCTTERDSRRLSFALDETHRLQNLLKEILSYAKPQVLQREKIDLLELFEEMEFIIKEMPEARDKSIQFVLETSPVFIEIDKDKIKQVFINLLQNACEAIKSGDIVTCTVKIATEGEQVCVSVHNGGTPIPPEVLPQLTQPFCSTKSGGTGLGLAIVKRIVEAHGGTLFIQSDAATGTKVDLFFPF